MNVLSIAALASLGLFKLFGSSETQSYLEFLQIKKILSIIAVFTVIQYLGQSLSKRLGSRKSSLITGFLAGIISSTALTVLLAKKSAHSKASTETAHFVSYLGATLAMLFEALAFVALGTTEFHASAFFLILGPILITSIAIFLKLRAKKTSTTHLENPASIDVLSTLRLLGFILTVLLLSKALQETLGRFGLVALTFFVSLFEIHGSIISNVQLHNSGAINEKFLCGLVAVSIAASYVSKLVIFQTLGGQVLKIQSRQWTVKIIALLVLIWFATI